eukprot:scaffold27667_cov102-Isochrysis_galbana.AAC.3
MGRNIFDVVGLSLEAVGSAHVSRNKLNVGALAWLRDIGAMMDTPEEGTGERKELGEGCGMSSVVGSFGIGDGRKRGADGGWSGGAQDVSSPSMARAHSVAVKIDQNTPSDERATLRGARAMAHLYRDLAVKSLYTDRAYEGGRERWQEAIEESTTLYIGALRRLPARRPFRGMQS